MPSATRTRLACLQDAARNSGSQFATLRKPIGCETLKAYWENPEPFEAERQAEQAALNRRLDAGMTELNAKQAARWAQEGDIA